MKWSIVMPSYNNLCEVWFTVQALRLYHDLSDAEIVVVDNFGDDGLQAFVEKSGAGKVRYDRYTAITGVSAAKNRAIEIARGDYVLCMDSHIMIKPGTLDVTPPGDDLVQGPLMQSDCRNYWLTWRPEWRSNMWGVWGPVVKELPTEPVEIWAQGAGFFACRRESWLGFNPGFRQFGGETGYIQEKYRKYGRKVWCDPRMVWMHLFYNQGRKIPFPAQMVNRVRNYILGFEELGLDTKQIEDHFGTGIYHQARSLITC